MTNHKNKEIGLLGGIGIICFLVGGALTGIGFLVGLALILVAYFYLGEKYNKDIWKNFLLSVIIPFASLLIAIPLAFCMYFVFKSTLLSIIFGILVPFVGLAISGWYTYESNLLLSNETKIDKFRVGGLLIFIGSLTFIFLIGFLISFIGHIFLCIGFFELREK